MPTPRRLPLLLIMTFIGLATSRLSPADPLTDLLARDVARITSAQFVGSTPTWTVESNVAGRLMGRSAVTAGDVNGDGFSDIVALSGNATEFLYLFLGSASGPALAPGFPVSMSPRAGGYVTPAGDLNGDGRGDIAITWSDGLGGRLRVYYGDPSGLALATPFDFLLSSTPFWGQWVAPGGDLNGDGYDDLVLGNKDSGPNLSICAATGMGQGRVDVMNGSSTGLSTISWTLWGCTIQGAGLFLGASAGTAGDVNGDGVDDLLIGAPGFVSPTSGLSSGAIWVVYGSLSGLPLTPGFTNLGTVVGATRIDSPTPLASFGASSCTAGDVNGDGFADVAVGSPSDDVFATDGGAARVFAGSSSGLTSTLLWSEGSGTPNARFGSVLTPAGDINADGKGDLLVATTTTISVAQSAGATLVIERNFTLSPTTNCGTAGDVNGDGISDLVLGETGFTGPESTEGRIRVYAGRGDGPATGSSWNSTTAFSEQNYGWSVASAGDVNGDGLDDVLVGSPNTDNVSNPGEVDNGLVQLFFGSLTGLPASASWSFLGAPNDGAGVSVCGIGDVNNDGYADFAVGATQAFTGNGKAHVFLGGPSLPASPNFTVTGPSFGSRFGNCVSGGDFNGDGFADLVVGAPFADPGGVSDAGSARVYLGSAGGLTLTHAWQGDGTQASEYFGVTLNGFADIDANGYTDLIVGASGYDAPAGIGSLLDQGRVFEYRGVAAATPLAFVKTLAGQLNEGFGYSVSNAGDIDGDGYGDVVIGAPNNNQTLSGQGRVAVHRGSPSGLVASPHWSQLGSEALSSFGSAVSSAGDVDGDGLSDVLVGAVFEDGGGPQDRGSARVFTGPLPSGAAAYWTAFGPGSFANLGHSLANAGDVDGDGWPEVVAGEPGFTNIASRQGRVDVYMGARDNSRLHLNLARKFSNGPNLVPMGAAANNLPYLRGFTPSPAGRTKYKSQWETQVSAAYGAINSSGQTAAWTSSTSYGPQFGQLCLMLTQVSVQNGAPYWWRYRSRYRSVFFPSSRWISPVRSGVREYDLRGPGTSWVSVGTPAAPITTLALSAANPMRGEAEITFALSRASDVVLDVVDLQGRVLRTLVQDVRRAGEHRASWDGADSEGHEVPAGVYFYRLRAGAENVSRKFVRMK